MCVIVYKPAGVKLDKDDLYECYLTNPDGAGFMYHSKKGVAIRKGYFNFDDMLRDYKKVGLTDKHEVVFHFRIATSGGISAGTCHPFPITDDIDKMKKTIQTTQAAVCHNGVLASSWGAEKMDSASDTMLATKYFLAPHRNLSLANAAAALAEMTSNRFAIMDNDGVELHGSWHKVGGSYYSNKNWCYYKYTPKKTKKAIITTPDNYENWRDYFYDDFDTEVDGDGMVFCGYCHSYVKLDVNCDFCGMPL